MDHRKTSPARWAGRILSALVALVLLADAAMTFMAGPTTQAQMESTGFPLHLSPVLAAVMLVCAVLYAIPRTAVLGAILITGFLGGAICTHLRLGEIGSPPQIVCLVLGLATWGGLWLRDPRVRALLPIVAR